MLEINQFKFSFFNRTARSDNRLVSLGSYFFSRRWIVPRVRSIERQSRFRKQKKNLTFSVHFLGRHRIRVVQSPVRSVALAGKGNGLQKKKKSFQSKKKKEKLEEKGSFCGGRRAETDAAPAPPVAPPDGRRRRSIGARRRGANCDGRRRRETIWASLHSPPASALCDAGAGNECQTKRIISRRY